MTILERALQALDRPPPWPEQTLVTAGDDTAVRRALPKLHYCHGLLPVEQALANFILGVRIPPKLQAEAREYLIAHHEPPHLEKVRRMEAAE